MDPERWRRIEEAFHAVADLGPAERSQYLLEWSSDNELRREVERLVASHEQADVFIEGAPPFDILTTSDAGVPGRRIGAYELIREIGRGGMGSVYLASRADEEFHKEVAIKVVQGGMDHESITRRFRMERQILAGLDHPNISHLLDGGSAPDGSPYFVMEYIEGLPIISYCDHRHLTTKARLRLFQAVCSAVHYAHQNLIVHRDIKPGNILVTTDGVPKLLDFGIAKLVSPGTPGRELTGVSGQVMTPEYASPEQVNCQPITTASDIYSLGVLLYELLTGQYPYRLSSGSPLDLAESICRQEPERPSVMVLRTAPEGTDRHGLSRELKGDLDNIVLKAIQKEPGRRYGSAAQLSEDIENYLLGLPVAARISTFAYRAGKFVRRHKAGAAAAALVTLALAAGGASTLWEARVAVAQRARAERRFNDARKLVRSFLFELDDAIHDLPGATPARSLIVHRALEYLASLAAESQDDRPLQEEMAEAYERIAEVQGNPLSPNLGDTQGALSSYRKALAIREALSRASQGNRQLRREVADLYGEISDVLIACGDTAGALAHSRQAVRIYETLSPHFATDRTFQNDLIVSNYKFANQLQMEGDIDGSLAAYERAATLSRRLIEADRTDPAGKIHLATSVDGIGNILRQKGNTAGALENRRQALAIREDLVAADPNSAHFRRQLGFAHHNLGLSLSDSGYLLQAMQHFQSELSLFESLRMADPTDAQAQRNVSLAHIQLGDTLARLTEWRASLEHYRIALEIDRKLSTADHGSAQALLDLSFSEGKFGWSLGKLGRHQEALTLVRQGVALQESLLSRDPHNDQLTGFLATSYTRLADCLTEDGATQIALTYYAKALGNRQALYARNPGNAVNRGALAESYLNLGKAVAPVDRTRGMENIRKAIELLEGLAAADAGNAQYRTDLADATTSAARLYVTMAARVDEPVNRRLGLLENAHSLYSRSQSLWLELERSGRLNVAGRRQSQAVVSELASCEASIARLQAAIR